MTTRAPAPRFACPGILSFETLRAAWDHVATSRSDAIPYRCSTCKAWHLGAGQGYQSTTTGACEPTGGPAERSGVERETRAAARTRQSTMSVPPAERREVAA